MSVSPGNLNSLIGFTGVAQDLAGANITSFTTSGSGGTLALASASVQTTGVPALGTAQGSSFTITGVSDAANTVTATVTFGGLPVGSFTVYVLAFTSNALLISTESSNQIATALANTTGGNYSSINNLIGLFAPSMLTQGVTVSLTATGTYTGTSTTPPVNLVNTNGTNVPAAIPGDNNEELITPAGPNSTLFLTPGYQSASINGATPATLVDTTGTALIASGGGNATLLSAASAGAADTLVAGSANNVLVSFNEPALETAAGQSGNNLFFGGTSPVTVQGGSGQDTVILDSGGVITTGTGGTQVWLNTGPTTVNSNGADTIVAGSGAVTVNVLGTKGVLDFGGSGSLDFIGGSGASTVVGLSASVTINGGAGGGLFYGGTKGGNVINSGTGPVTMVGGGSGDLLTATGSASDVLEASGGTETLNASGSSGTDAFFGGAGSDSMVGGTGANFFTAGPGNMTLVGGGSSDTYIFLAGATSATQIQGFNTAHDTIKLNGFTAFADQTALNGATSADGGTLLTLGDGTKIVLAGISPGSLNILNFS